MAKRLAIAIMVSCMILWAAINGGSTDWVIRPGPILASTTGACGAGGPGCLVQWADRDSGIFMASNLTQRTVYDGAGVAQNKTANYTAQASDDGTLLTFSNSSALTLTLPIITGVIPPFPSWWIQVENRGIGSLAISPNGLLLDGSGASLTLTTNQGVTIYNDGSNYYTQRGISGGGSPHTLGMSWGMSGGGALSTGTSYSPVTFGCTIGSKWFAKSDGTITFDIRVNGSSIVAAAPPTASAGSNSGNTTGWTLSVGGTSTTAAEFSWIIASVSGSPTYAYVGFPCQ